MACFGVLVTESLETSVAQSGSLRLRLMHGMVRAGPVFGLGSSPGGNEVSAFELSIV